MKSPTGLMFAAAALGLITVSCGSGDETTSVGADAMVEIPEEEVFDVHPESVGLTQAPTPVQAVMPDMNARRGRILFALKGCVICHQVNGIGGRAAPDLTAFKAAEAINPLVFSSRMWRGASAMTQLQSIELGYTIELDAQDIADLAAFAASPDEQALFTLAAVGQEMQTWFLDDRFWITGNWEEYAKRGSKIPKMDEGVEQ